MFANNSKNNQKASRRKQYCKRNSTQITFESYGQRNELHPQKTSNWFGLYSQANRTHIHMVYANDKVCNLVKRFLGVCKLAEQLFGVRSSGRMLIVSVESDISEATATTSTTTTITTSTGATAKPTTTIKPTEKLCLHENRITTKAPNINTIDYRNKHSHIRFVLIQETSKPLCHPLSRVFCARQTIY